MMTSCRPSPVFVNLNTHNDSSSNSNGYIPSSSSSSSSSSSIATAPAAAAASPAAAAAPKFTASFASVPSSVASSTPTTPTSTVSGASSGLAASEAAKHREWLEAQQAAMRDYRKQRHNEWVQRHEAAVVEAVPIKPRLSMLLSAARTHERALPFKNAAAAMAAICNNAIDAAAAADDRPHHEVVAADLAAQRAVHIDAAYRNLLDDVHRRCAVIASHNPTAQQQFSLGSEAIGCFSTMLPWSEGVVGLDVSVTPPPQPQPPVPVGQQQQQQQPTFAQSEYHAAAVSGSAAAAQPSATQTAQQRHPPLPRGLKPMQRKVAHPPAAAAAGPQAAASSSSSPAAPAPAAADRVTRSAAQPAVAYKWTLPTRLAVDGRKLQAVTTARRTRLHLMNAAAAATGRVAAPADAVPPVAPRPMAA